MTLFGVVHPEGGGWFIGKIWQFTTSDGSRIQISFTNSFYAMEVVTEGPDNKTEDSDFLTWVNEVIYGYQPFLRCFLDALGLHVGAVLDPEMTGGVVEGYGVLGNLPAMAAYGTVDGASLVGDEALIPTALLAASDVFYRSALADVRNALRFDTDSPFFCYRALDSLREYYAAATNAKSKDASWQTLRTELGIEEAEIMALKAFADERRHGGAGTSVHADHLKWTKWTREIVGRFIAKNYSADIPEPSGRA